MDILCSISDLPANLSELEQSGKKIAEIRRVGEDQYQITLEGEQTKEVVKKKLPKISREEFVPFAAALSKMHQAINQFADAVGIVESKFDYALNDLFTVFLNWIGLNDQATISDTQFDDFICGIFDDMLAGDITADEAYDRFCKMKEDMGL